MNYTSFIEELNYLNLDTLLAYFNRENKFLPMEFRGYEDIWLQEVALRIAGFGKQGTLVLLHEADNADERHLCSILTALSWEKEQNKEIETLIAMSLDDPRPTIVEAAIDTARLLDYRNYKDQVEAHLVAESPFVVGSAIRYFSRLFPLETKSLLIGMLSSTDPIILQNVIDELDELDASETLPLIMPFLSFENEQVRDAATNAIHHFHTHNIR